MLEKQGPQDVNSSSVDVGAADSFHFPSPAPHLARPLIGGVVRTAIESDQTLRGAINLYHQDTNHDTIPWSVSLQAKVRFD